MYIYGALPLTGNNGANITKSADEEGDGLQKEIDKVVVLPMNKIIASAQEEENSKSQFQEMKSAKIFSINMLERVQEKNYLSF